MGWTEIMPGKKGLERVRVPRMRGGTVLVSLSEAVAKRNKMAKGTKVRVFADLEASPRQVRIAVDPAGGFGVRVTRGGAAIIAIGKLSGLSHITFEAAECEFDECTDDSKRLCIDVELPKALQVPSKAAVAVPSLPMPSVSAARVQNGVRR